MKSCVFGAELPPLSSPRGRLSSPVTPEGGQTLPHLCRACWCKGWEAVVDGGGSAAGPVSQVQLRLWSPATDLHVSQTRNRGREHAAEPVSPPFSPCSLQIWKKGLIVFNNMLSNPPITTTLPSLIRIRITSGAMFCPSLLLNLITTRSRGRDRAGFLSTLFAFFLPLAHLICLAAPSLLRLH